MIRFFLLLLFLSVFAFSGVNPFVIFNTNKIKSSQALIPLPKEQLIRKDSTFRNVKVLLLAEETLYISTSSSHHPTINVQSSLDGKLFKKDTLKQNHYKQYIFKNPYAQNIALKLQSSSDINASLYTTANTSVLNILNPKAVILGKNPKDIILSTGVSLEQYYDFEPQQRFAFELEDQGTLKLSLRAKLHPLKTLSPYRQRIRLTLNHKKSYLLDALNSTSLAYIEDANQTPLTSASTHFIPLEKGKNHIQIESDSAILLSANFYHENIINRLNKSTLQWKIPQRLDFINQAQWKNSSLDAGRKKMFALLQIKKNIYDSLQRSQLDLMARKSTFSQTLFPSTFPQKERLSYLNYAKSKLYLEEAYQARASIHPEYATAHLNGLQEGIFCRIPSVQTEAKSIAFESTQEQLYFNSNGFILDKKLKRQVKTLVSHLKSDTHIMLYGHTDSVAQKGYNQTLSFKRCQSVKAQLIAEGVPSQKISIAYTGEENPRIRTFDETQEASNRRVEIKVTHHSSLKPYLEYTFIKPLEAQTQIEFTVFSPDKNSKNSKNIMIKTNKNKRYTLNYQKNSAFEPLRLSQATQAFILKENLQEVLNYTPRQRVALVKNKSEKPFVKETATFPLHFAKGTSSFRIWTQYPHKNTKISVSMPQSSVYKDTPFALSHHYENTSARLRKSLSSALPQTFDSWYEHTHPLRLWIRSQLSQAKVNLSPTAVREVSTLRYAKKLKLTHDRTASLQIAKQGLFRSPSATIQAQSFKLLLALSQTANEKLKWIANYFEKTGSPQQLEAMSTLLEQEGKYRYALDARLLLKYSPANLKKICELCLVSNRFVLYDSLCNKKAQKIDYLGKKQKLIESQKYLSHSSSKAIKVKNTEGITMLYSAQRKQSFPSYKATFAHPLEIEVQGPLVLKMNIQFAQPHSRYAWMKIEHENTIYHYPLTQFKASEGVVKMPNSQPIGLSNHLVLQLPKGRHRLRFHAYEIPLLFTLKASKPTAILLPSLSSQVFKTSGYNPLSLLAQTPKSSLAYASALLWNYRYATLDYRSHAQAQAFLLSQVTDNTQVKGILSAVLRYSSFVTYPTPQAPLGFYDVPVPVWNPSANIEKNRLPLLKGIQDYALVLHGADYKIIHLEGEQTFRLEAKQITTKYFPFHPLRFAISCDGKPEKIISLDPKTQTWSHDFSIGKSRHSIKLRLLDPLSTQYLVFNMYEDGEKIEQESTKRYFASSLHTPIMLYEQGPKLLRIEEIKEDNSIHIRYHFLEKSQSHSLKVFPSNPKEESLFHLSYLSFDPLKKITETLSIREELPLLFDEVDISTHKKVPALFALKQQSNERNQSLSIPFEAYSPTMSMGISSLNKELGSDDEENPLTLGVLQLNTSLRMRIREDMFLKMHYYTNLYDKPLYALEHKLSYQLAFFDNLFMSVEANAYFQENNNYLFKAFQVKAQVYHKETLSPHWSHKYGAGIFKYFLDYNNPDDEILDPLVYSRYKRDHQQGVYGLYQLMYFPYDDLGFSFKGRLGSNEKFNIIDNAKIQLNLYHHLHPFDIKVHFDKYYYIEDRDRAETYSLDRIGASLRFEKFMKTQRLQLEASSNYNFSTENSQLSLNMIWYFSQNKRFYHFSPEEKIFNALRLRLEDETE